MMRVGLVLLFVAGRARADDTVTTPVSTPLVLVGAGTSLDGTIASASAGWAWGTHEEGLFPGTTVTRVLAGGTYNADASSVNATIGWYRTAFLDLGFDAGIEARRHAAGPATRITLGVHGVTARFGAAGLFDGDGVTLAASAELVLDVMELARRL